MEETNEINQEKNVFWKLYQGKPLTNLEEKNVNVVEVRSLFWKALLGEISPKEMEERFNMRSLSFSHLIKIHLDPIAIIHILEKYLQHEIDELFVKEWALFVLMMDCYVSPNYEYYISHNDDTADDKYEEVWYVVQQLSAPEIDGHLTLEKAREHINVLEKFMKEIS